MEGQILRAARQRPIILLTGARQSGKTSALRRLLPQHPYVSLDSPSEAEQVDHEGHSFLERHGSPLRDAEDLSFCHPPETILPPRQVE